MSGAISSIGNVFSSPKTGLFIKSAGSLITGVGQFINAKEETETGDFNAAVFEQRSRAQRASQDLLEQQKRKILKSQIGTQIALFAKSGIKFSGSAIEVMTDSIANAEMDIAIDRYNSEVEARGFETDARLERFQAQQRSAKALAKGSSTFISTAADLIKAQQKLGQGDEDKGETLGAGTTSHGIKVPSRYVPPK